MGGIASKVLGRGAKSTEPGAHNAPTDADGAAASQGAASHTAATEEGKHHSKHEAGAHGKEAERGAAASEDTKHADQQHPKHHLEHAKEDAIHMLESVKKSVGAAKEKFFEKSEEAGKDAAKESKHIAHETKEAAEHAAHSAEKEVSSHAHRAHKSAEAAAEAAEKKGEEGAHKAKDEAHSMAHKSREALSGAEKDAAASVHEHAEHAKKASHEAAESAAEKGASAMEMAKEKAHEAAEVLREKTEHAASAFREAAKDAHEKGKEKIESLRHHGKHEESSEEGKPAEERKSAEAAGHGHSESTSKHSKHSHHEESKRSEAKPHDAGKEHAVYTAMLDVNAAAGGESVLAAKTVAMKNDAKEGDGTFELSFNKPAKDGPQEAAETSPKAVSQEALDSAKTEAELLVERVISSVVGASESLEHSADDSAHSEKDRVEKLKEMAQQEFALCQEKAHHLLSDVSSAVSTAATTVAAKSAEIYDATKSKAHDLSEQVTAKASDTAESLKHGMHTLQEQAMELPQLILHKSHVPSGGETTTTGGSSSVPEVPHEQAPLLQADTQRETPGDRLSPSPKPEDIESAVVKIQAGVRGYLTRKNLLSRTQQDGEASQATGNANQEELSAAVASNGATSETSDTEAAATKIQAAFRGYMVRKELKPDNGPGSGASGHKEELIESR